MYQVFLNSVPSKIGFSILDEDEARLDVSVMIADYTDPYGPYVIFSGKTTEILVGDRKWLEFHNHMKDDLQDSYTAAEIRMVMLKGLLALISSCKGIGELASVLSERGFVETDGEEFYKLFLGNSYSGHPSDKARIVDFALEQLGLDGVKDSLRWTDYFDFKITIPLRVDPDHVQTWTVDHVCKWELVPYQFLPLS